MARASRAAATVLSSIFRPAMSGIICSSSSSFSSAAIAAAAAAAQRPLLRRSLLPPFATRCLSSAPLSEWRSAAATMAAASSSSHLRPGQSPISVGTWATLLPPSVAAAGQRSYSKRPNKRHGGPHAFVQVEPGAPCPPYSPNAGSVKKRKHNKRMAQRHAFAKAQAHVRKEQTKAAVIKRDAARKKRWREGAVRARAWAKHLRQQQETAAAATPLTT